MVRLKGLVSKPKELPLVLWQPSKIVLFKAGGVDLERIYKHRKLK